MAASVPSTPTQGESGPRPGLTRPASPRQATSTEAGRGPTPGSTQIRFRRWESPCSSLNKTRPPCFQGHLGSGGLGPVPRLPCIVSPEPHPLVADGFKCHVLGNGVGVPIIWSSRRSRGTDAELVRGAISGRLFVCGDGRPSGSAASAPATACSSGQGPVLLSEPCSPFGHFSRKSSSPVFSG